MDKDTGLIHSVETTAANVHDLTPAAELLHGEEEVVYGDAGYQGIEKRPEMKGNTAMFRVAMRPGKRRALPDTEEGRLLDLVELAKAHVRAKVEHPFRVIKQQFGFQKTRLRGMAKNGGVRAYAEAMASFAAMPYLRMCVAKLPLAELIDQRAASTLRAHLERVTAIALHHDSRQAVRKLCEQNSSGELLFRHEPPLIWRHAELPSDVLGGMAWRERFEFVYADYLKSIRPELRHLLMHFRLSDAALKAVGVGSVGTRCAIGVFVGDHPDDVLVLQSKQAEPSVLAPYVDQPAPEHQGQRVVQGQRLMQTSSDAFLGWSTTPEGDPFYWRHFRNWKGSVDVAQLDAQGLKDYGKLCGWTLAKAHARSGDRRAVTTCIGEPRSFASDLFERALVHANQMEQDHRALVDAIDQGRLEASEMA